MGRLVINADDFGLTAGVNRAVAELHSAGVLTSATLMARAGATEEAIEFVRRTPSLGVGCHVVLVDGDPVLPPKYIPTLVDQGTGRFQPTSGAFLRRLLTGRIRPAEIEAEVAAQIYFLKNKGVALTHIDTHKHAHMWPAVLWPVLRAARAAGICAVRNPFEPAWSMRATPTAPWARRAKMAPLRGLLPEFQKLVDKAGFATTDGTIGVLATGTLDEAALNSLLRTLPEGAWELVTHPGYDDADLAKIRTRLRASREIERNALLTLRQRKEIDLTSFAGLLARAQPEATQ